MLVKLLKYDLTKILKFISVFYIITLTLSILTRFFINTDSPFIVFIIGRILSGAVISMFANILINCIMGIWIRSFARNVYRDESYLTHTLPVTKKQIYLSKFLCVIIVAAISIAVITVCAFIAYYTDARWQIIKQMFFIDNNAALITLLSVLTVFLELINLIQCGFTGIILGHRQNSAKVGLSVLFAFVAQIVTQIIVLAFTGIAALISNDFRQLFQSQTAAVEIQKILYWIIPVYIIIIVFTAMLNIKILNKGVDVE